MEYTIDKLKNEGFSGFRTIRSLKSSGCECVPSCEGNYIVVRPDKSEPTFLSTGTGGYFKGKNPNVPVAELKENWLPDAEVLYIGKATDLKRRLSEYMKFGEGKNIGHYGGRYIWQLKNSNDLLVCWKPTRTDSREAEKQMLEEFTMQYGELPFANLAR